MSCHSGVAISSAFDRECSSNEGRKDVEALDLHDLRGGSRFC
jgi:hypothetical protein